MNIYDEAIGYRAQIEWSFATILLLAYSNALYVIDGSNVKSTV